jgi:dTDP-4-dehydrorhamnose 3,5-epimerase
MNVISTPLPGVLILEPRMFGDARGHFFESFRQQAFDEHVRQADGSPFAFVQDNQSRSTAGVLRGLHYQIEQPQGKLVRVSRGEVFDVAVDLRRHSPNFGKWTGAVLSEENRRQLWVPPGFGHGFMALSDVTDVLYKTTDYYAPAHERCVAWNDAAIGIEWPAGITPLLSAKDQAGASLALAELFP